MARVTFSDDAMWELLGCVVHTGEGQPVSCGPEPRPVLMAMELAGYLWLRPRHSGSGYLVQPTPLGCSTAHRWASRQAKEAAVAFGRAPG